MVEEWLPVKLVKGSIPGVDNGRLPFSESGPVSCVFTYMQEPCGCTGELNSRCYNSVNKILRNAAPTRVADPYKVFNTETMLIVRRLTSLCHSVSTKQPDLVPEHLAGRGGCGVVN